MNDRPLKPEDIKVGDKLEGSNGRVTIQFKVKRIIADYGFDTHFGPIPWANLHMLRKKSKRR